jgi:hypothetical protein
MFDSYETDIIRVIEVSYDKYGVETTVESADIGARIEDVNKIINDIDGKEIKAHTLILFSYETNIEKLYRIKIREKKGVVYEDPDYEWQITKFENNGMFGRTHVEVYLGDFA